MKVVIYSRVSTQIQEYQRQTTELQEFATKMGWTVVRVFEEKVSGGKLNEDRPALMELFDFIEKSKSDGKQIHKVCSWELSRIGRNSIEVLKTMEMFNKNGISLYIKNFNLETLNEKGEVNPLTQFMVQILTSVSEMERTTIRMRMKSGYDNYRKTHKVGRKVGYRKSESQLIEENKDVLKLLKQGFSVRKIMKLCDKSSGTVQKVKKMIT